MDCQYIQQNDFAEKYLREELAESERTAYEEHLQQCAACRKELERQRLLIDGLREIGRAEMKQEIRRQVAERRGAGSGIDWGLLLKVAAVLLFVVITPGVIYYYQFVLPPQPESLEAPVPITAIPAQISKPSAVRGEPVKPEEEKLGAASQPSQPAQPAAKRKVATRHSETQRLDKTGLAPTGETKETMDAGSRAPRAKAHTAKRPVNADRRLPPLYQRGGGKGKQPPQKKYLEPMENLADQEISAPPSGEKPPVYRFFGYLSELEISDQTNRQAGEAVENAVSRAGGGNTLLFRGDRNLLKIHLVESDLLEADTALGNLPRAFPVKIISRKPGSMEMNWQINRAFRQYLPSNIRIEETGSRELQIQLGEKYSYRFSIAGDSTEAILIK